MTTTGTTTTIDTPERTASGDALTLDDIRDRATLSIDETAAVLGIARGVAYASARSGEGFPVRRIGRRLLVPVPALLAWLAEN